MWFVHGTSWWLYVHQNRSSKKWTTTHFKWLAKSHQLVSATQIIRSCFVSFSNIESNPVILSLFRFDLFIAYCINITQIFTILEKKSSYFLWRTWTVYTQLQQFSVCCLPLLKDLTQDPQCPPWQTSAMTCSLLVTGQLFKTAPIWLPLH